MTWVEVIGIGAALVSVVFDAVLFYLGHMALARLGLCLGMIVTAFSGGDTDDDGDEGE